MAVFQAPQMKLRMADRWIPLLLLPVLVAICVLVVRGSWLLQATRTVVYLPAGTGPHGSGTLQAAGLNGDSPWVPYGSGGAGDGSLPGEAWAGFAPPDITSGHTEVLKLLSKKDKMELQQLCGRCLYHQLNISIAYGNAHKVFVATGDIPHMWIRDSAVQLGALVPRMADRPALRMLVEGAVRTQAFMIIQDPYANAYFLKWQHPSTMDKNSRMLGRGGWVATRNYELDSGAYFLHLLWNLYSTPGYGRAALLAEPVVFEAASLMVDIWTVEQHHEQRSQYRYSELPREGLGSPVNYTGLSWCGFRPSDDPQKYGYNVPVNMYAQGALERALVLNANVWRSRSFDTRARALAESIQEGIERWGVVEVGGEKVYAYELDGLGNTLVDFDDANVPSLLSIPLLGYRYDPKIYEATRKRILSSKNPYFFKGPQIEGIGSQHTPSQMVWSLAISVQGLTTSSAAERAQMLQTLLKMQCGNGLMHESVSVNEPSTCTRQWFGWANAMLVALVESSLGYDCGKYAERQRLAGIKAREKADESGQPQNGGPDNPLYYETLEATVWFDTDTLAVPEYYGR